MDDSILKEFTDPPLLIANVILPLAIIIMASIFRLGAETESLLFIALGAAVFILRVDTRPIIILSAAAIFFSGISLIAGNQHNADALALGAFWMLALRLAGVIAWSFDRSIFDSCISYVKDRSGYDLRSCAGRWVHGASSYIRANSPCPGWFEGRVFPFVFYFILALILMQPLFGSGYFLTLDLQFGPNTYSDHTFGDLYGSDPNAYGGNLPMRLALSAISGLIPPELLEKIILFSVLFLSGYLMHLSLPKELGNSRYFAGLLYMLNPFVFVRFLAGHWMLLLSYAFIPMGVSSFMGFLKRPSDTGALVKTALWTILASVSIHGVLMLMIVYGCLFAYGLLRPDPGKDYRRTMISRTIFLAAIVLLANLFWIMPSFLLTSKGTALAPASAYLEDFGTHSKDMPLPLAVLTMHGFWREGFTYTKDIFSLWLMPFLAILGFSVAGIYSLAREKRPFLVPLLVVFVLAFLLALGQGSPLSGVFTIFGDTLPLFIIFRDTQKFVALLALCYSILGAYGMSHLMGFIRNKGAVSVILLVAILLIPVIYDYGFFGFIGQARLSHYPDDWVNAERIMSADPSDTAILVLPLHLYTELPWVNTSVGTIANPAQLFFSRPVVLADTIETKNIVADMESPRTAYLNRLISDARHINNTAELLLPINARYIIIMMGQPDAVDSLFLLYNKSDIEFIFRGDNIMLYRNNLATGPFFASREAGTGDFKSLPDQSSEGRYSTDVTYSKITPALFRISSSTYPYVVYAGPYQSAMDFSGSEASPWHGIATVFGFSGPGFFENRMFMLVLSLLLLSWAVCFILLSGSGTGSILPLAAVAVAVAYLSLIGIVGPAMIGAFLMITAILAIWIRQRKAPSMQN